MKAAVIVFPGSNCDRDVFVTLAKTPGIEPFYVWHKQADFDKADLLVLPGGFSFGDYLRCGAIAARAPIVPALASHVKNGGYAIGICNGFQVLLETGLLPGALMRNAGLKFVCRTVPLRVETVSSAFTSGYEAGEEITLPVAHHDGNYRADAETLAALRAEDRIAFTYGEDVNGSEGGIAGILSANRRVLGLMPHPERAADPALGPADGQRLFAGLADALMPQAAGA